MNNRDLSTGRIQVYLGNPDGPEKKWDQRRWRDSVRAFKQRRAAKLDRAAVKQAAAVVVFLICAAIAGAALWKTGNFVDWR